MTDDLVTRLRKVDPDTPGERTRWYRNPDGPEAADRIEQLEAALQRYVCRCKDVTATGAQVCTHGIPTTSLCGWEARKALEGKDD